MVSKTKMTGSSLWIKFGETPLDGVTMDLKSKLIMTIVHGTVDHSEEGLMRFFGISRVRAKDLRVGHLDRFSIESLLKMVAKVPVETRPKLQLEFPTPVHHVKGFLTGTICKDGDLIGVFATGLGGTEHKVIATNSMQCKKSTTPPPKAYKVPTKRFKK